jgi:hypothetical protein
MNTRTTWGSHIHAEQRETKEHLGGATEQGQKWKERIAHPETK